MGGNRSLRGGGTCGRVGRGVRLVGCAWFAAHLHGNVGSAHNRGADRRGRFVVCNGLRRVHGRRGVRGRDCRGAPARSLQRRAAHSRYATFAQLSRGGGCSRARVCVVVVLRAYETRYAHRYERNGYAPHRAVRRNSAVSLARAGARQTQNRGDNRVLADNCDGGGVLGLRTYDFGLYRTRRLRNKREKAVGLGTQLKKEKKSYESYT